MSFRNSSGTRVERVVSFVAAIGVTVIAGLIMMLAPGSGFLAAFSVRPTVSIAADRVVYVASPRAAQPPPAVSRPQIGESSARGRAAARTATRSGSGVTALNADTAVAAPKSERVEATTSRANPPSVPRVAAGAPAAAATVGFTHPSEPTKFDSAVSAVNERFKEGLASGLLRPPPPTQDEIDRKLRAEALEAIVARGAGSPVRRVMIGASVPVGLLGGGPSNKQRARDRAIFAELQKIVALRQQKAESIATARKRRVDSLAQLADSGRRRQNRNH